MHDDSVVPGTERIRAPAGAAERDGGMEPRLPWGQYPGFTESLRILVEEELFTLTDIAEMLGLSRERVRQLCAARGIRRPLLSGPRQIVRVWDDRTNRFRPLLQQDLTRACRAIQSELRQLEFHRRRTAKRESIRATLTELKSALGRDPTVREMYVALGGTAADEGARVWWIMSRWGQNRDMTARQTWEQILSSAGIRPRKPGSPGHVGARRKSRGTRSRPRGKGGRGN